MSPPRPWRAFRGSRSSYRHKTTRISLLLDRRTGFSDPALMKRRWKHLYFYFWCYSPPERDLRAIEFDYHRPAKWMAGDFAYTATSSYPHRFKSLLPAVRAIHAMNLQGLVTGCPRELYVPHLWSYTSAASSPEQRINLAQQLSWLEWIPPSRQWVKQCQLREGIAWKGPDRAATENPRYQYNFTSGFILAFSTLQPIAVFYSSTDSRFLFFNR